MSELKPCPFCGVKPEHKTSPVGFGKVSHYVRCPGCGSTQWSGKGTRTEDEAAEAWNKRVFPGVVALYAKLEYSSEDDPLVRVQ